MAVRIVIHSPKGGQGKTTITANLAMMLAERKKRVLVLDTCPSKGLQLYFNVDAEMGLSELLTGEDFSNLAGEIQRNLTFLPGGDLVEVERLLTEDKISPYLNLEEKLKDQDKNFDYVLVDTAPTEDSRLFFAVLFYADKIITPIETKRAGLDLLVRFRDLLESINPRLRQREKKPDLVINQIVPYWYGRSKAKAQALEILQEEFEKIVTEPVGECTGLIESWAQGESLENRIKKQKSPPSNEEHIVKVFKTLLAGINGKGAKK